MQQCRIQPPYTPCLRAAALILLVMLANGNTQNALNTLHAQPSTTQSRATQNTPPHSPAFMSHTGDFAEDDAITRSDGKFHRESFGSTAEYSRNAEHDARCCGRALAAFERLKNSQRSQKSQANAGTQAVVTRQRPYNALRYSLFMDWTNPLSAQDDRGAARRWQGAQTMTVRVDSAQMDVLTVNGLFLEIDSAFVQYSSSTAGGGGSFVRITTPIYYAPATEEISIQLPRAARRGDTLTVRMHYTHTRTSNDAGGGGFLLYRKGTYAGRLGRDSVFTQERLAYTMSQPNDARQWMPCNDVPSDKVLCDIAVRVPAQFTTVANGLLERVVSDSAGNGTLNTPTKTFYWQHKHLVPPYLMVAVASVYKRQAYQMPRATNPADSILIHNYYWAVDDTASRATTTQYSINGTLGGVQGAIEAYSRWFGEYPFEGFGTAVLQPFGAGGMEHQTMQTINRSWLRGIQWGVAHEVMHHWFGDYVTCGSWSDIWLNEGGATYGESLWYESWGGEPWFSQNQLRFRSDYLRDARNATPLYITNPDTASVELMFNYSTTYLKASWVYHMLRRMLGDAVYFPAMREYLRRFAYGTATTEDLRRTLEELVPNPPVPFRTFFDQWVYKPLHPVYDVVWRATPLAVNQASSKPQEWEVQATLSQVQAGRGVPETFVMPVSLTFVGSTNDQRVTKSVLNNQRSQNVSAVLSFQPTRVIVDDENAILCARTDRAAGLQRQDSLKTLLFNVYPQPLRAGEGLSVEFTLERQETVKIELLDLLGKRVAIIFDGTLGAGTQYIPWMDDGFAAQGAYFLRCTIGTAQRTRQVMLAR